MEANSLQQQPLPPTQWSEEEIAAGIASYPQDGSYVLQFSETNPTPGTGRTGFIPVGPNNYPHYSADELYKPVLQADGGQLSGGGSVVGEKGGAFGCETMMTPAQHGMCRHPGRCLLSTHTQPISLHTHVQSGSPCTSPARSRQRLTGRQHMQQECLTVSVSGAMRQGEESVVCQQLAALCTLRR